jgi:hypothetical protein
VNRGPTLESTGRNGNKGGSITFVFLFVVCERRQAPWLDGKSALGSECDNPPGGRPGADPGCVVVLTEGEWPFWFCGWLWNWFPRICNLCAPRAGHNPPAIRLGMAERHRVELRNNPTPDEVIEDERFEQIAALQFLRGEWEAVYDFE